MNNILELASKLYQLANICKEAAELLEVIQHELPIQNTTPLKLDDGPIHLTDLIEWPATNHISIEPKFSTLFNDSLNNTSDNILEIIPAQSTPIDFETQRVREIICLENHDGEFIRHIKFPRDSFELIIINYALEFSENPLELLLDCKKVLKPGGVIYLLYRPWTSSNGGYQHNYLDKSFLHLCADLEHNCEIKTKMLKPQAQIQELIDNAQLKIVTKLLHTQAPPNDIVRNKEIIDKK